MNGLCDRRDFVKIGAAAGISWAIGYYKEFEHPLWKAWGEKALARGGHGGADAITLHRLINALRTGVHPDIDVYDAATWSCITELSEKSVAHKSSPMDFPDFTGGRWKTAPPVGILGL